MGTTHIRGPRCAPTPEPAVSCLTLELPDALVSTIAERVAEMLAERQASAAEDGFLGVGGAAEFLACPASRIYSLVSAKRLPHYKDGSRLLFDRRELRQYVRNGGARRP